MTCTMSLGEPTVNDPELAENVPAPDDKRGKSRKTGIGRCVLITDL